MKENKKLTESERMEKEEREAFQDMALKAHRFVNNPAQEAFRGLFEIMLKMCGEMLEMIAQEQSDPNRKGNNANIQALGLQAANLSGQAKAYRSMLEAPNMFIQQWEDYQEKKKLQKGEKTS